MSPRRARILGVLCLVVVFRLWDGRVLEVREYLQHGDEYVITLVDGTMVILRQSDVREVGPAPGGAPPAPPPSPPASRPGAPPR